MAIIDNVHRNQLLNGRNRTGSSATLAEVLQLMMNGKTLPSIPVDLTLDPSGSDSHGQGGLLGTLLSVQERNQPAWEKAEPTLHSPRDNQFRQLSRVAGPVSTASPSYQRSSDRSMFGDVHSNSLRASSPSTGVTPIETFEQSTSDRELTMPVGWRFRGAPIPVAPPTATSPPPITTPKIPEWWYAVPSVGRLLLEGMYGQLGNGRGAYGRCVRASGGSVNDWEEFCRFLARRENNTVGGESQNRACWSKTYQSENEKKQWCENQFGSE